MAGNKDQKEKSVDLNQTQKRFYNPQATIVKINSDNMAIINQIAKQLALVFDVQPTSAVMVDQDKGNEIRYFQFLKVQVPENSKNAPAGGSTE